MAVLGDSDSDSASAAPAVAPHCLGAFGQRRGRSAGHGEHGPGGSILEQNANSVQVCESWNGASERQQEKKMPRDKLQFAFGFPFSTKAILGLIN